MPCEVCVWQVVGLDETSEYDHKLVFGMIVEHVRRLRTIPAFRGACCVLAVERNYGGPMEATMAVDFLTQAGLQPVHVISEERGSGSRSLPGVVTDLTAKKFYINTLQQLMHKGGIVWAEDGVFVSTQMEREKAQREMCGQMMRYRRDVIKSKTHDSADGTVKIHGKNHSGSERDDLMMALQMAVYWGSTKMSDPHFISMSRRNGWY